MPAAAALPRHQLQPRCILVHQREALKVCMRPDAGRVRKRAASPSTVARVVEQADRAKVAGAVLKHLQQRARRHRQRPLEACQQHSRDGVLAGVAIVQDSRERRVELGGRRVARIALGDAVAQRESRTGIVPAAHPRRGALRLVLQLWLADVWTAVHAGAAALPVLVLDGGREGVAAPGVGVQAADVLCRQALHVGRVKVAIVAERRAER
mmetsp:Transcript_5070/g.16500  ORF Transcript_5070/g.16500 Transcript_5070/m.16500 type:complete len:210 (+) Transcript_5070:411-1040(+)